MLTYKNGFRFLLIVILLLLILEMCHRSKVPEKPQIVSVKEQVIKVQKDEAAMKKQADSFTRIINILDKTNDDNYKDLVYFVNENSRLQQDIMYISKTAPDTCQKYVGLYKRYADQTNRTISTASKTIDGLRTTVNTQKSFLSAKDSAYAKLKTSWDTCISSVRQLTEYASAIKPKREVSIGVNGMGSYAGELNPAIGLQLGYRNKKGFEINAAVYSNLVITVGVKKPLFRF